jgi:putative membrane protein
LIWLAPLCLGILLSKWLRYAAFNELVFGAFLAWGFETLVINGVFLRSKFQSLIIGAVHPVPILLLILTAATHDLIVPVFAGIAVLAISMMFLSIVGRVKTDNGIAALDMLRAFLKTWVAKEPAELESYFSRYAKHDTVITKLILTKTDEGEAAFVLPGVHPGPFSPVGSYNLSELIYEKLSLKRIAPVVLHGTGGHENNVPTNQLTSEYASKISDAASSEQATSNASVRGPVFNKIGITRITTLAFGNEVLAIVSNSPYRSDDLDPATFVESSRAAAELHLNVMVVDAHNSVDGEVKPQEPITESDWRDILTRTLQRDDLGLRFGLGNSNEIGFQHESDISDGGITVALLANQVGRYVLVSVDANNAVSGLRERIEAELLTLGLTLIDVCTSDTHKLAARNMTSRGYFALGEQTNQDLILDCVKKLVKLSENRLAPCKLKVVTLRESVPLIGTESLDDFAQMTKNTISLTKRCAPAVAIGLAILLTVTLIY